MHGKRIPFLNPTQDLGEGRDEKRDTVQTRKVRKQWNNLLYAFVKLTKKDIAKDMKIMVLEILLFALIPSCEAVEPSDLQKMLVVQRTILGIWRILMQFYELEFSRDPITDVGEVKNKTHL